ncbi:hypothetical protein EDD15DRAFT_988495 [Pisolithus albus]|nr:hypothetical protein EDD15DRAFT_988495 [Pisolithus albus]
MVKSAQSYSLLDPAGIPRMHFDRQVSPTKALKCRRGPVASLSAMSALFLLIYASIPTRVYVSGHGVWLMGTTEAGLSPWSYTWPPSEGSLSISFRTIPTAYSEIGRVSAVTFFVHHLDLLTTREKASPTPIIISSSHNSRRTLPIWSILQLLLLFTTVFSLARPVTEVSFVLMCGS